MLVIIIMKKNKKGGGKNWDNMYLEYNKGSSHKFWEITRDKSKITTRWGRIDTKGQETTKDYGSKAKDQYTKMVASKKKKGYVSHWKKGSTTHDCTKMVMYKKQKSFKINTYKNGKRKVKTIKIPVIKGAIKGIQGDKGTIYKYKGKFNQFADKPTPIPKDYVKIKLSPDEIKLYCGENETKQVKHKGKQYLTHDNGGRPFLVTIDGKHVCIYRVPKAKANMLDDFPAKEDYSEMVKEYKGVTKIFIGKSSAKSKMAKFSGGHGSKFDGNTILIEISPKRYCHIGCDVFEFSTKDSIQKYDSPVGNNDVPYPLAYGTEYLYFLISPCEYIPKHVVSDTLTTDELWDKFHGVFKEGGPWVSEVDKDKKKLKIKMIQKRLY